MNTIDLNLPVAEIINQHPEVKEILVELGLKPWLIQPCSTQLVR